MTTILNPPNEALTEAATNWPDDVTAVLVTLGQWLSAPVTGERARTYDRLIDSMYEWLEASDGLHLRPLLKDAIGQVEVVQDHLLRSAEAAPSLF